MDLPDGVDQEAAHQHFNDKVSSDLVHLLQEAGVPLGLQYRMTLHFDTIGKFSAYADTRATIRTALRDDFALEGDSLEKRSAVAAVIMAWESCKSYVTKEADIKAEAKLLGVTRPIAHTDRTAMKAAFEKIHYRLEEHLEPSEAYLSAKVEEVEGSEITASPLSDVTSRKTSRDSGIQTTVDQNGHVRVVKSKVKGQLPQNTEELRLALKVEGHMWTMLSSKFRNIGLFRGMGPGVWADFSDYLMGEKVYLMKIPNQYGDNTGVRPPWHVLLQYEFQVRKEAVKTSVRENRPLAEVLPEKSRDSEIREQHFISPIALQSMINEGRGNRLRWQQQTPTQQRWQPYQPWSRNTEKGDKGYKGKLIDMKGDYKGGKSKGSKGKDKDGKGKRVLTHTPDGRQICYAFNEGGCDGSCGRVHICQVPGCGQQHPMWQHWQKKAGGGDGSKGTDKA